MPDAADDAPGRSLILVVPSYNDWDALALLLDAIDPVAAQLPWHVRVVVVDDGSDTAPPANRLGSGRRGIAAVEVLTLRRNLGHQRAIAVALAWVESQRPCDAVLVMDGDGEDSPSDLPLLLERYRQTEGQRIVFAARHRRSEGLVFQTLYHLYRAAHWLLTGIGVRVGNFSVIPRPQLHRLVVVSDLWNHYAAAVFKARLPITLVPTSRAARLSGRGKMNFTQLVVHGLSAISVFGDRVGVRLLFAATLSTLAMIVSGAVLVTSSALEGLAWSSKLALVCAGATYLVLNLLVPVTLFAFSVLSSRESAGFLPARDYAWFVSSVATMWSRDDR